jgi:hypothetical protein
VPGAVVKSNGRIPDLHFPDDKLDQPFDLVVSRGLRRVAVEISFQVTTNSVIERKRAQAAPRYELLHNAGYKIAYVIDGVGNFFRKPAIRQICQYSDCTVALSSSELELLCQFIKEELGNE